MNNGASSIASKDIVETKNFSSSETKCFPVETKCFSSPIKEQIPHFVREEGGF